jgi:DNA repair protein RadD
MDLRDYQQDAIEALRASLASGKKRPVVQMPTGAGKTICAAEIVRMARLKGNSVIFTVPAISLVDQTVDRFAANGIYEVGVMQAAHYLTDHTQPVQVASVQTLARRQLPKADIVIVDEAHLMFKFYDRWFNDPDWKDIPIVGLTATPWQKGMAKLWDDLIIGTTTDELIKLGHLSDFKVFAPAHPDLRGVKTVAGDYEIKGLGSAMNKNELVADIVSTWLAKADNRPTLCFAVNRLHAKHIQQQFEEAGVKTAYLDAFSTLDERKQVAKDFAEGAVKVVCNVGVLTTGVDWDVRCIILARPTKSEILFTQIIGRGLRTAEGKDHCLILDHSDTTLRLGFVTDIHHDKLDSGEKTVVQPKDKIKLPKECPKCHFLRPPGTKVCPACGFEAQPVNKIESVNGELYEISRQKKQVVEDISNKQSFYSELIRYALDRGYKRGWAWYAFKDKYGMTPPSWMHHQPADWVSDATTRYIKYLHIRRAKSRSKHAAQS